MTREPSLFDDGEHTAQARLAPLAVRMRPRSLDEVAGQQHLLGAGSPLRRLVEGGPERGSSSILLWGPPGTGKTTLATLVARASGGRFRELSAVTAGVKDVRAVIDEARHTLAMTGAATVLFVDEVHRFSKTQQDALLPAVENRWVTLVAATTENPSFSVVSPLLSRSLLLTLQPLTDDDISALVDRALLDERGLAGAVTLTAQARSHLVRMAGGDARRALTALEAGAGAASSGEVDLGTLEQAVDTAAVRYDRDGDQHYDVISAFIKSLRGSDVDAALHYLARMLTAGEDPRFVARRLIVLASEDIGLADPTALTTAVAAAQALEMVGLPEARLALAQATIHLALAPKSNAVITALGAADADVRAGLAGSVPPHLRDAHYAGATRLGHGQSYRYPHDHPGHVARQQYAPDELVGRSYYAPTDRGAEAPLVERTARLRALLRGERRTPAPPAPAAPVSVPAPQAPPAARDRPAGGEGAGQ